MRIHLRSRRWQRRRLAAPAVGMTVALILVLTPTATATTDSFSGNISVSGPNWRSHSFTVAHPGSIVATLDWNQPSADLNLALKDPGGVVVARAVSTTKRPEVIRYNAPVIGTYSLAVSVKAGSAAYTLNVEHPNVPDPGQSDGDWPMFMRDPLHSGTSSETAVGASNVAGMGIQWQANTGAASYVSPVVAYSSELDKSLVYVGNQQGAVSAYDAATGERQWWFKVPNAIFASPAVADNVVYVGSADHHMYALNASTGGLICKFYSGGVISASPVIADPDGSGKLVYFGDNGLSGADDGGRLWAMNAVDPNAAGNCTQKWSFNAWGDPPGSLPKAGSWSPPAYATDSTGRPLVVFGSSNPDDAVYALDARNGSKVWRYQTEIFGFDDDVGAGPTISPPGVNGFAGGVAYVSGKNRITYALNLTTGQKIWEFRIRNDSPTSGGATRSTAALVGDRLYVGYGSGLYALNAVSGAKVWKTEDVGPATNQVISSPAISGAEGDRVAFVGDLNGNFYAFSVATGARLWTYETAGFVYGSAAVAEDKIFITSSDGFLYAFGLGGGEASAKPETTLEQPVDGSELTNSGGALHLSGDAGDDKSVSRVMVAIKNKSMNAWWDGATGKWRGVFMENPATMSSPGGTSTDWTFDGFEIPFGGGQYYAQAEAVDDDGQHDSTVAASHFSIASAGTPPDTTVTSPQFRQIIYFPNGRNSFPITVTGTATDTVGAKPGVSKVKVVVENTGHKEYFCGSAGCSAAGTESSFWQPKYTIVDAVLENPGATQTNWSLTVPVYNHPHQYRIVAWAIDRDNELDPTRAIVQTFCIRDPGVKTCPYV